MYCTKCGNKINDGDAFCPICGNKVSNISTDISENNQSGTSNTEIKAQNENFAASGPTNSAQTTTQD